MGKLSAFSIRTLILHCNCQLHLPSVWESTLPVGRNYVQLPASTVYSHLTCMNSHNTEVSLCDKRDKDLKVNRVSILYFGYFPALNVI